MIEEAAKPAALRVGLRDTGGIARRLNPPPSPRLPRYLRARPVPRPDTPSAAARADCGPPAATLAFPAEFHIAAEVREKYRFAESLFRSNGNAIFADFRAVREFAARMNEQRGPGERPVRAGELNAMGLIDEILHFIFRLYESTVNPGVLARGVAAMEDDLGHHGFRTTVHAFVDRFPPVAVHRREMTAFRWLEGATDGRNHPEVSLEELLMLHLANINPAFAPYRELFDDGRLAGQTAYERLLSGFRSFLRTEKPFGAGGGSILDVLEEPMRAHPDSLAGQLGYIRDRWGVYLSDEYRRKILSSGDLAREDMKQYPTGGSGPVTAPDYAALTGPGLAEYPETENFTHDTDWMPNVVLLAKNVYVWLHQLSKEHGRHISRLDEVPDEELDRLASWNFTSVWLIGVWHRSAASERIKKLTGNPEAAPSAYSLYEYEIAPDLGGEEAFGILARRAWDRGIRLAADMVPNHTGIASRWIRERPEYFIQADHPPFPVYRFTGPDLSGDPDYQVRIEDGYWTRTDAAVVFQHTDNRTGRLRYIYHGNDGTNMPWNDTAQLDFLRKDVRDAVIGQILRVAKKFSVIRFDAAMTLAKKHFQRLWYPHPGTGGDIPSRADCAMLQEDFDRLFPLEFWREVVDRINAEMPQTLLLAEAFWLLEGYFVRTLGMHRVYNSAFMHMLMKEDNAMYRGAIRSTLHFNPEILKRYVNFMSNPDEETAVGQFGKGDKYFGIATLMVTLPGLPMFAHGQVEGYREKYGMEYRKDYHDETPDADLVRRHEREIFPLLKLRRLFSQTEHFELYDVTGAQGGTIEDIFAFSNMAGEQRTLVCYNNRYETWSGTLKMSSGKLSGGTLRYASVGDALRLDRGDGVYYLFREHRSGLEFLRSGAELHRDGFFVHLRGFESQVFLDFREVRDADGRWGRLYAELRGGGVPDASKAARAMLLRRFTGAVAALFDPLIVDGFAGYLTGRTPEAGFEPDEVAGRMREAAKAMAEIKETAAPAPGKRPAGPTAVRAPDAVLIGRLSGLRKFFIALEEHEEGSGVGAALPPGTPKAGGTAPAATPGTGFRLSAGDGKESVRVILAVAVIEALFGVDRSAGPPLPEALFDEWLLGETLEAAFLRTRSDTERNARESQMVRCLVCAGGPLPSPAFADRLAEVFSSPAVAGFLRLNEYQGLVYFHRESFVELVGQVLLGEAHRRGAAAGYRGKEWTRVIGDLGRIGRLLLGGAEASGYSFRHFLGYLQSDEFRTLPAGPVPARQQGP